MPIVQRVIESKPFNADGSVVDVVCETYDNGAVVEYPLPSPRIVLNVDKPAILADGADEAMMTATFEVCSLTEPVTHTDEEGNVVVDVPAELAWSQVIPTGDAMFVVNLRPTTVSVDADGKALLALSTTIAGVYRITVSFAGYADAYATVEAMV